MKSTTNPGLNRTGLAASPLHAGELLEVTELTNPSSPGDAQDTLTPRMQYAEGAEPPGTMPPPASLKELGNTTLKALTGQKATVLVDKLGERLAFERTGTRLYEGILAKFDVFGSWDGGPTREELARIHQDEHRHFLLLQDLIRRLGSDPTAVTPSANLHAVASSGILKVISDPRMDLKQSLEAIAIAELADNDCWANLVELLRASGHAEMADECEEALEDEQEHLVMVRQWITSSLASSAALPLVRKPVKRQLEKAKRPPPARQAVKAKSKAKSAAPRKTTRTKAKTGRAVTRKRAGAAAKTARKKKAPGRGR